MRTCRNRKVVQYPIHHDRIRAISYRENSPERKLAGHPALIAILLTGALAWLLGVALTSIEVANVSIGSWALFG